ncbi:MAG: hypothetical protein N3B21_11465 [Clostridia bacterium]|nr:hypothetical protein [Clostridia bacterium]
MQTGNYSLEFISDLEWESINNYAVKESFEIIEDEVEYFFESKEYLVDVFVEGIAFDKLSSKCLQERFHKVFYSPKVLEAFILRLEKKIGRELARTQFKVSFDVSSQMNSVLDLEDSFSLIIEEAKTLRLSSSTEKAIDMVWKKSSQGLIPKELKKFSSQFKVGEYFLSTVGLSSKEIRDSINKKLARILRGIIKQSKTEIVNILKNEILAQTLYVESLRPAAIVRLDKAKTA